MATEKQIAANRANAKNSTGPKTAAGKERSSRNAYQHGLSGPKLADLSSSAKANAIAGALVGRQATGDRLTLAKEFAHAQLELARIRAIRADQWAKIGPNDDLEFDFSDLKRLAALDRYERYACTKRRRASKVLLSKDD